MAHKRWTYGLAISGVILSQGFLASSVAWATSVAPTSRSFRRVVIPLESERVPQTGAKVNPWVFKETSLSRIHSAGCTLNGKDQHTALWESEDGPDKSLIVWLSKDASPTELECRGYSEDDLKWYRINMQKSADPKPRGIIEPHPAGTWSNKH